MTAQRPISNNITQFLAHFETDLNVYINFDFRQMINIFVHIVQNIMKEKFPFFRRGESKQQAVMKY